MGNQNIKEPRLSLQSLKVLQAFAANPEKAYCGSEIMEVAGIASGTLYPILIRFENAGWLTSSWENICPSEEGRPRKRFYKISGHGLRKANEAFEWVTQGLLA